MNWNTRYASESLSPAEHFQQLHAVFDRDDKAWSQHRESCEYCHHPEAQVADHQYTRKLIDNCDRCSSDLLCDEHRRVDFIHWAAQLDKGNACPHCQDEDHERTMMILTKKRLQPPPQDFHDRIVELHQEVCPTCLSCNPGGPKNQQSQPKRIRFRDSWEGLE